jgi:hypothetical protein
MARVEIASQSWGWAVDLNGKPKRYHAVTFSGTVYAASAGATTISPVSTLYDGTIPGWTDPGTYTLTIDGVTHSVEAVSGAAGGGGTAGHTIADETSALTQRATLNFTGAGVTATDNSGAGRTDVTIPGGGGTAGHTIADEGSALTQRATLNFIGAGVAATDNAGSNRTDVTISSGGSSPTIQDEGSALTARSTINFVGAGVTATDDAANTRTLVTIPGGGSATLPWVNAADYGFAQGASAATIKTALVNAIAALPSGRGTVLLPDADVTIDLSAGGVNIGTSQVRLVGGGRTRIKCSNENSTGSMTMFNLNGNGGTLEVEKLRLEGPDVLGTGGGIDLIAATGTSSGGRMTAIDCELAKCSQALRVTTSVNWDGWIEAFSCKFTGYNGTTSQHSTTCILTNSTGTGLIGRGVRIKDCEFRAFGLSASSLYHAIYLYTDWSAEITNCHFITSIGTGYGIQFFDSASPAFTASQHQQVIGCKFYSTLTVRGILIGNKARPLIRHCIFENNLKWIGWDSGTGVAGTGGGGEIVNNIFSGTIPSGAGLEPTNVGGDAGVRVAGNRFIGSSPTLILVPNGYWTIENNEFAPGATITNCLDVLGAPTKMVVQGNTFRGNATQWIYMEAGGTALVHGNFFWQTTGIGFRNGSTGTTQQIVANDFSQVAGASVSNTTTPTLYHAKGNYGTTGLTDV